MKNLIVKVLATLGLCTSCSAQNDVQVLEPKAFIEAAQADSTAVLLDVRTPAEYAEGHLAKAVNLDWLDPKVFSAGMERLDKAHTYYIYCRSGKRSNSAAVKMQAEGFKVFDMKGGYLEWTKLQMPVVK